ncbi:hypothetical protein GpartN1_g5924.t1 [Galdieria partita]|uniref:BAR domain-containing protein n=1 Tax=Galdieria partita TaxID=83374 RepID=A0A9C7Q0E6_9RHOD|nr:hypothetical protein GpartN1_g5924.t1 [Galdieria partita]
MGDFYDPSFAEEDSAVHNKTTGGWSETLRHFGVEAKRAAERTKQSILQKMGKVETTKNVQLDSALEKYTQMGAALDRLRRDAQNSLDSLQNYCSFQSTFAHSLEAAVRLCSYDEARGKDSLEAASTLLLGGQVTLLDGVLYESQKKFRACIFKVLDEEKLREKDVQSRLEARKKILADYERYRARLESEASQETLKKLNNKKQELDAITRGLEDTLETAIPRRRLLVEHVITEFLEISQKFYHEASRIFDQIADGANTEKLASLSVSGDKEETRPSSLSQQRVSEERSRSTSQGSGSNATEEPPIDKYSQRGASQRRPPSPPLVFSGVSIGAHENLVEEDSSSSSEEDTSTGKEMKEPTRSTSGHMWNIHDEREANLLGSDEEERDDSRGKSFSFKAADNDQSNSNQKFFETPSESSRSSRQRSSSFQADSPTTTKKNSLFEEEETKVEEDTSSDDDDALSHPASRSRSFDDLLGESRRNETLEEGDLLGDFDNANTQGEKNETKKPNPFDDDFLFSSGEFSSAPPQSTSEPDSGISFNKKENVDLSSGAESEETIRARLEPRVEAKINQWTLHGTRKTNLRLLLSMLHTVLWSGARWKPVDFQSLSNPDKVKAVYKKAILILHPDKFQQSGYTVEQKMIAERCFSILREAHDYFEAELKGKPIPNPANAGASNASQMYPNGQQGSYYPAGGMGRGGNAGYPPPPPPYANGAYYHPNQGNMPFSGMPSHGPPPPPPPHPGSAYGAPPPPPPYGWDPRMGQRRYPPY